MPLRNLLPQTQPEGPVPLLSPYLLHSLQLFKLLPRLRLRLPLLLRLGSFFLLSSLLCDFFLSLGCCFCFFHLFLGKGRLLFRTTAMGRS